MLVEVVLVVGGGLWRNHLSLPALPTAGSVLWVPAEPPVPATVAGALTALDGLVDGTVAGAVLARVPASPAPSTGTLHRAGWHRLL